MDNENKWEYDYSSQDKNESGDTGYPNVGSSGMNTANQYNNEPEAMRDIMMIYGGLRRPAAGTGDRLHRPADRQRRRRCNAAGTSGTAAGRAAP